MSGPIKIQQALPLKQANDRSSQEKKLREVAAMYEKHFLREMVKAMRATVPEGSLTPPSMAEDIYKGQLDQQYVEQWGDKGGIGLNEMIYKQLADRFLQKPVLRPSGPVQLGTRSQVREIKTDTPNSALELQKKSKQYLIEADPNERQVTSPWEANIEKKMSDDNGRQTFHLSHPNGLKSVVSFTGTSALKGQNQWVKAGQKLGEVSLDQLALSWQIRERV